MIMINFINFVFSLKSKHENKKKNSMEIIHHLSGILFCFPEKSFATDWIRMESLQVSRLLQKNRWKPYRGEVSIYKHLFMPACQTTQKVHHKLKPLLAFKKKVIQLFILGVKYW